MKKILIAILLLFTGSLFAQASMPKSWTTNYRFKQYNQGANPTADSLNHNWTLVDTYIKLAYDSAQAKGSKKVANTWTAANTFSSTVTFNGAIAANATFTANNIIPETDATYTFGSLSKQWYRGYFNSVRAAQFVIYNPSATDSAYMTLGDSTISFNKEVSFQVSDILPTTGSRIGNDTSSFTRVYADTITSGESYLFLEGKQGGVEFADVFGIGDPTARAITAATTTVDASGLSYVELTESEAVTGLHTFTAGATRREGGILVVVNSSNQNVTLKNGTGNMILGADLVLAQYDTATFVYYDIGGGSMRWLCIANRNN